MVDAAAAVADIERGAVAYVTGHDSWSRIPVKTMSGLGGTFLFANWDGTGRNNLHDLAADPPTVASACVHVRPQRRGLWRRVRGLMAGRATRG